MKRLGIVSIGQTTDSDFVPVIREIAGPDIEVVVRGALDGLSDEGLAALAPAPDEHPVITELNDGRSVKISKPKLVPRINAIMRTIGAVNITFGVSVLSLVVVVAIMAALGAGASAVSTARAELWNL